MINCLISDCAGRHTTHVPAGGAAKRFILFNNKSKTNGGLPLQPACMGPSSESRAVAPGQDKDPSQKEGAGAPHTFLAFQGWH